MTSLLPGCIAVGIQVILAVSVNMMSGYARQISFGQAAFAGLGAYTSALLSVHLHLSFWLACPLSVLITGSIGVLLGLPVLRRMPYYVPVMTLTFNALVHDLLRPGRLGGAMGLGLIPPPQLFGEAFAPDRYLLLVGVALGVCLTVDGWLWRSHVGQSLRDDLARDAETCPPTAPYAVLTAFGISTAMAGLAGSLFAHFEASIRPVDFDLEASLFVLALAAFGGLGSSSGVVLGAVLLSGVVESLPVLTAYRLFLSGVILLLVGLWRPQGLLQWTRRRRPGPSTNHTPSSS